MLKYMYIYSEQIYLLHYFEYGIHSGLRGNPGVESMRILSVQKKTGEPSGPPVVVVLSPGVG